MNKRILTIVALVVIIGAITWRLASNKRILDAQKEMPTDRNIAIPVAVYEVKKQDIENNLIKAGKLIPNKKANIMSTGNGKIEQLYFDIGSQVQRGATLAKLDSRLLQLNLEATKLNYKKAEKDLARFTKLLEGEATTESTFQDVKLNYETTSNQIESIKKQISDNTIKAPISGQIVRKDVELGEFIGAGSVLGHIVDISKLKAKVFVSEKDVYTLKVGNKVTVSTDVYKGLEFDGEISFISSQGDDAHNYEVEVTLNNPSSNPLKAGTYAYVNFNRQSLENVLVIPRSAIVESIQNPYVYVIKDNIAERRDIVIAKDLGEFLEVVSGIAEGEIVITSGQINISNGSKVNPITNN